MSAASPGRGHDRRVMARALAPAAAAALVLATGACSGGTADAVPSRPVSAAQPTAPATTPATTASATATAPPTTTSTPSTNPREAAAGPANVKLTASLFSLVTTLKKLQTDNTLPALRKRLTAASTSARGALKRQRAAAYPSSTRSCPAVRSNADQVAAQTSEGYAARRQIFNQVSLLSADLAAVRGASATVATHRDKLATALKGASNLTSTLTPADIKSALADATSKTAQVSGSVAAAETANAEFGRTFDKLVTQSRQIRTDACP